VQALLVIFVVLVAIGLIVKFWYVGVAIAVAYLVVRLVRHVRKERYFASEGFLAHRRELEAVVAEHNDVAAYAKEIRAGGQFQLGASSRGAQAHLASFENTSRHNYRRDRNVANLSAPNVHNCSLQVVRNASSDPIKYLIKYFEIKPNEATLEDIEQFSDSIGRLENALKNLRDREAAITASINPPRFILKHYRDEFMSRAGVELSPIEVNYPTYVFEYVSAGGNSSQRSIVTLNTETTDALIETLGERIRFSRSAAGQRALMTGKLRNYIKERDNHTCQNLACGVSVHKEPHLLLEVDHIQPISKGGLSTPSNLQTLCWRCNRTKSNKVLAG
jgi:HNH endonuclease